MPRKLDSSGVTTARLALKLSSKAASLRATASICTSSRQSFIRCARPVSSSPQSTSSRRLHPPIKSGQTSILARAQSSLKKSPRSHLKLIATRWLCNSRICQIRLRVYPWSSKVLSAPRLNTSRAPTSPSPLTSLKWMARVRNLSR